MKVTLSRSMLFVLFITLTTIIACRKSIFDRAPQTQVQKAYNQYEVKYQSSTEDSILHFELEIAKNGISDDIVNEAFDIDLRGKKYLTSIYHTLHEKSLDSKYSSITEKQARELCVSLREVIADYTKSLTKEQIQSSNVQGMFMSLAFVRRILKNKLGVSLMESKILARKLRLGTTSTVFNPGTPPVITPTFPPLTLQPAYAQDVYEGYETGLSAFVLNEDVIIDRQALLSIVNDDAAAAPSDDQGLYVFQDVLNNISFSTFSLKDLLAELDFYVAQRPENIIEASGGCAGGWWPSGSTHGCCANYPGCCYFWHPVCYIHDKMCVKCIPRWFCLSGCKPDPAIQVTTRPFTFVEDAIPGGLITDIHLPTPLPEGIYYKTNYEELSLFIPQLYTTIVTNLADDLYYTDSTYTTLVPDGYYDSPAEINGEHHIYYHIETGVITEQFSIIIHN